MVNGSKAEGPGRKKVGITLEKTYERLEDNKVKFTITIPADEVDAAIDSVYKEVNASARIPGFRKGKAPRAVLNSNFGAEYFTSQATGNLINATAEQSVDDSDMVSLGNFEFGDEEFMVEPGKDFVYSFTIEVKPVLELSSYEPVEVTLDPLNATEEEIDEQLEVLRSYYIELKEVERPVENDDIVQYSQRVELDGKDLPEGSFETRTIVVGNGTKPTLDTEIIGAEIGIEKKITATSEEVGIGDAYPGAMVDAFITVKEIHAKTQPEITDEWVKKTAEYETVDELRATIAQSIIAGKQERYENDRQLAVLDTLAERLVGEPSETYIADCNMHVLRDFFNTLESQGVSLDQYLESTGKTAEDFNKEVEEQGLLLAKQNLAIDAVIRHEEMTVSEDDILQQLFISEVDNAQDILDSWKNEKRLSELRETIIRDMAAKWLVANAKINYSGEEEAEIDGEVVEESAEPIAEAVEDAPAEAPAEPAEAEEA